MLSSTKVHSDHPVPTNFEIKFRVANLGEVQQKASQLASSGPTELVQEDVFFPVSKGRLKLRKFDDGNAELIAYDREDSSDVRQSKWFAYPTADANQLEAVLVESLGKGIVVRKNRTLYLVGSTRIHLDTVDELGTFVELEVMIEKGLSVGEAKAVADGLIDDLGLDRCERISVAYADLLAAK